MNRSQIALGGRLAEIWKDRGYSHPCTSGVLSSLTLWTLRNFYRPICTIQSTLQWRHYDRGGVSNHQPHDCLFSRLFRHRWNKTSKHRVTGLCEGNSPVTGEFPAQRASNTENVSISWRHHEQELHGIYDRQINLSTLSDNTVRAYVLELLCASACICGAKIMNSRDVFNHIHQGCFAGVKEGTPATNKKIELLDPLFFHMMTSSNGNIFRITDPVPVNSPHKGQWRGALMFSLICAWINDWVNNCEAVDLRRHRGHYDVNVMNIQCHVNVCMGQQPEKTSAIDTVWPALTVSSMYDFVVFCQCCAVCTAVLFRLVF